MTHAPQSAPSWSRLEQAAARLKGQRLVDVVGRNESRADALSLNCWGFGADFTRSYVDMEALELLFSFARERDVEWWRKQLFEGEVVNTTENRPALHMALRAGNEKVTGTASAEITAAVDAALQKLKDFTGGVRDGRIKSASGAKFETVIHIGIGGSDLGPRFVCTALADKADGPAIRFVRNVDPADLADALKNADPETTLFIIASKTFTTRETMANAAAAKVWLTEKLGVGASTRHFVAATANHAAAKQWGVPDEQIFPLWDWVGGRFSLWSSVGLPIALSLGFEAFEKLLGGARDADRHFLQTPLERNIPVMMGLLGFWYRNFWHTTALAVLPYAKRLSLLPDFLQQLVMESNGKGVDRAGRPVTVNPAPIVFGQAGTDVQHAFFQMLHQAPQMIPVDFIAVADSGGYDAAHHAILNVNAVAQARALMEGREDRQNPWRACPGNRPSNLYVLQRLSPYDLGMLLAFYEHQVFVEGILAGVNSFDQWGVELGKQLADGLLGNAAVPSNGVAIQEVIHHNAGMDLSTRKAVGLVFNLKR